jgi:hypothetical protein
MVEIPTQNNLPRPNHGSEKSDWLGQTNKQTLTIFNEPITLSFRKGNNYNVPSSFSKKIEKAIF